MDPGNVLNLGVILYVYNTTTNNSIPYFRYNSRTHYIGTVGIHFLRA